MSYLSDRWTKEASMPGFLAIQCIAGIYHEALNLANFTIWDALAKIKLAHISDP